MKHTRFYPILLFTVILATLLTACGGAAAPTLVADMADTGDDEGYYDEVAAEEIEEEAMDDFESEAMYDVDTSAEELPNMQDRMVIKNGSMSLTVEDIDTAVSRITQIATDNGGYLLSNEVYQVDDHKAATLTIAVVSDRYEAALERLRSIAIEVEHESSSGQDVTAEYVDLESRLRNLEATRDRLTTFLDDADNVQEALNVNRELSSIEAEIEQVKGRMKYLQGRAAMSTITVDLQLPAAPIEPKPEPEPQTFGAFLREAGQTQVGVFGGFIRVVSWLVIVPGPYLLALGLIVYGIHRWTKRSDQAVVPSP